MLYLMLICYDPHVPLDDDEPRSLQPEHAALGVQLRAEGILVGGSALAPPELAPVLRAKSGRVLSDGPFAETKELAGGFYIIDCKDDEDAVRQASRIPISRHAWIQARRMYLTSFEENAPRSYGEG